MDIPLVNSRGWEKFVWSKYEYDNDDNGVIDIRILDEGESVKIEIEDNGKGIAAKDIGNIF